MADDSSAPATKGDITAVRADINTAVNAAVVMLRGEIAIVYDEMNRRFFAVDERFDAVDRRFDSLEKRFDDLKTTILDHFNLTVETIRYDLLGANKDDIENIKIRVTRLEQHTGLVA